MRWRQPVNFVIRWIALALIGWLAYTLLRGLWAIIRLDAPVYDWLWYAAMIPLLTVLPLYAVWRLTSGRPIAPNLPNLKSRDAKVSPLAIFAAIIVLAVTGYGGFGQVVVLEPDGSEPIPISFWASSDFRNTPDSVLTDLRSAGGRIYFGAAGYFPLEGERGAALSAAMRRLADYDVEMG